MANKVIIDGDVCFGSTDSANIIKCKNKNGNESNVQVELDSLHDDIDDIITNVGDNIQENLTEINNKIPFSFGVDANGNYGYYKDGADTVTPFKTVKFQKLTLSHAAQSSSSAVSGTLTISDALPGDILNIFMYGLDGSSSNTFTLSISGGASYSTTINTLGTKIDTVTVANASPITVSLKSTSTTNRVITGVVFAY